jgi:hypothetical protein
MHYINRLAEKVYRQSNCVNAEFRRQMFDERDIDPLLLHEFNISKAWHLQHGDINATRLKVREVMPILPIKAENAHSHLMPAFFKFTG